MPGQDLRRELHLAAGRGEASLLVLLVLDRLLVHRHASRVLLELFDRQPRGFEQPLQSRLVRCCEVGSPIVPEGTGGTTSRVQELVVQSQLGGQGEDDLHVRPRLAQRLDGRL